jgi:hypothetical protein
MEDADHERQRNVVGEEADATMRDVKQAGWDSGGRAFRGTRRSWRGGWGGEIGNGRNGSRRKLHAFFFPDVLVLGP